MGGGILMKKMITILIGTIIIFSSCFQSYADHHGHINDNLINSGIGDSEIEEIRLELISIYKDSKEFLLEAKNKDINFIELINEKAYETYKMRQMISKLYNGINPNIVIGDVYYANVPVIKQSTSNNCGAASVLQALYGLGCQLNVSGSTDNSKMGTLTKEMNIEENGSAYVYLVTDALNKYSSNYTYFYYGINSMNMNQLKNRIATSLQFDAPPILHARTEYLGYYNGHQSGHYIAVGSINVATDKITVKDCNYNDKYRGTFNITLEEAYNALDSYRDERFLICLTH